MRKPESTDSGDRHASAEEQRQAAEDRKAAAAAEAQEVQEAQEAQEGKGFLERHRDAQGVQGKGRIGEPFEGAGKIGGGKKGGLGDTRDWEKGRIGEDFEGAGKIGGAADEMGERNARRKAEAAAPAERAEAPANAAEAAAPAERAEPPANAAAETTTPPLEDEFNISSSEDDLRAKIEAVQADLATLASTVATLDHDSNTDFDADSYALSEDTEDDTVSPNYWSTLPFWSEVSGVGQVKVYPGYFSIGGRQSTAHLIPATVVGITATGHCILRVTKDSGFAYTFYYSSSLSAPNSATNYEWIIFSAEWDATTGHVTITHRSIGNKTVYATV